MGSASTVSLYLHRHWLGRVQQLDWDLRPENIERYFARLEAAIVTADAEAYQQSAQDSWQRSLIK